MPLRPERALEPVLALALVVGLAVTSDGAAQERTIDRWLTTSTDAAPGGASPLAGSDGPVFPDRDARAGPGYWHLVRDDGASRISLDGGGGRVRGGEVEDGGGTTLAHAYLKAPRDMTVTLRVAVPGCSAFGIWLNGQTLPIESEGAARVRLASGWNTLLIAVPGDRGCEPVVSAGLAIPRTMAPVGVTPPEISAIGIQASRPPGVRPNRPEGTVEVGVPEPLGLVWRAGEDELLARVGYALTAWGGDGAAAGTDGGRPDGPPAVDLSGEWELTLFSPTGIQRLDGTLTMEPDGALEGRFEGGRMDGEIRDGWVSGTRFGWSLRVSGRGRELEAAFEGTIEDGEMRGTMDFGGFRDFESRFEGRRAGEDGEGRADGEGGEPGADRPEPPRAPDEGRSGSGQRSPGSGLFPGATQLEDGAAQRDRMIRQLFPPAPPRAPAPDRASIELRIGGERIVGAAAGLAPAVPTRLEGEAPFEKLREAALDDRGVEARVRWADDDDETRFAGRADAEAVLAAFHDPIEVAGLTGASGSGWSGTLRIPDRFAGFTLRAVGPRWTVDGTPLSEGIVCSPCRRGQRLDVRIEAGAGPAVEVVDPGYAGSGDPVEWLRSLRGDNRAYRERAAGS